MFFKRRNVYTFVWVSVLKLLSRLIKCCPDTKTYYMVPMSEFQLQKGLLICTWKEGKKKGFCCRKNLPRGKLIEMQIVKWRAHVVHVAPLNFLKASLEGTSVDLQTFLCTLCFWLLKQDRAMREFFLATGKFSVPGKIPKTDASSSTFVVNPSSCSRLTETSFLLWYVVCLLENLHLLHLFNMQHWWSNVRQQRRLTISDNWQLPRAQKDSLFDSTLLICRWTSGEKVLCEFLHTFSKLEDSPLAKHYTKPLQTSLEEFGESLYQV